MNHLLRIERRRALLSQYQLAKKVGISQAYISAIERGDIVARNDLKQKIAYALGKDVFTVFPVDDFSVENSK